MSLVILPPAPKGLPFTDDWELPLSAKQVDDDYLVPTVAWSARVWPLPFFADEDSRPLTAKIIEDELGQPNATYFYRPFPIPFFADEDSLPLAATIVEDEFGQPLGVFFYRPAAQPIGAEDENFPPPPVLDEDPWLAPVLSLLRMQVFAQPITDDEVRPLAAKIVEDEFGQPQGVFVYRPAAQPFTSDDDVRAVPSPMPDVTGMYFYDAILALRGRGFSVSQMTFVDSPPPFGIVVKQALLDVGPLVGSVPYTYVQIVVTAQLVALPKVIP